MLLLFTCRIRKCYLFCLHLNYRNCCFLQVHSALELEDKLQRHDGKLVVLMCKAASCRPCKVSLPLELARWFQRSHIIMLLFAPQEERGPGVQQQLQSTTLLGCGAQMFARKYQRMAAEFSTQGAVFLEILGDESADTRVCGILSFLPERAVLRHPCTP